MKRIHICSALTATALLLLTITSVLGASMNLSGDPAAWSFSGTGHYSGYAADMRGLLRIEHAWEHSEAGSYGAFSRPVTVPADWAAPLYLRFYCSDNYFGMGLSASARFAPAAAVSKFVGHRIKQVLINGVQIWQRDIADEDRVTIFAVDISNYVKPGETFTLSVRNYEQVATTQALADDLLTKGTYGYDTPPENSGWEYNFSTICCFGDVELFSGQAPDVPAKSSLWNFSITPADLTPRPTPARSEVPLLMEYPERLGPEPFPVSCGVPFHRGELRDVRQLALLDSNGRQVPVQAGVLGTWEDGSVKWVLLDFMASSANTAADRPYRMVFGTQSRPVAFDSRLETREEFGRLVARNHRLSVVFGQPGEQDLIKAVYMDDPKQPVAQELRLAYTVQGQLDRDTVQATIDTITQEDVGRVRSRFLISGRMLGQQGTNYGRFTLRVDLWDNSGFMRLYPRIFIDTPERKRLDISSYDLSMRTRFGREAIATTAATDPRALGRQIAVSQNGWHTSAVKGPDGETLVAGKHADGWVDIRDGVAGLATYVQDFSELFPKQLIVSDRRIRVGLFSPGALSPLYQPMQGESKRHQVMLFFHTGALDKAELAKTWDAVQRQPRLFDQQWFRDTLALGHVGLDTPQAEVVPGMHQAIGAAGWVQVNNPEHNSCAYGIRHYPDGGPVPSEEIFDKACPLNFYYDALHAIGMEYVATADRSLFDQLERGVWHVMDIDTCHWSPQAPWRVGGQYGPGSYKESNHNDMDYALSPKMTYLNGILDYYFLTGDPDALETAKLVAGFDMNPEMRAAHWPEGWDGALRCISFPMWNVARMFAEFHAPEYDQAFRWYLGRVMDGSELRRGSVEGPCAQPGYKGATPGHGAIAMRALMQYYDVTGDQEVGRFAAAIGMDVYEECTRPEDALLLQFTLKRPQNFMVSYVGMTFDVFPYTAWLTGNQKVMDFAYEYAKVGVAGGQMNNIFWNFAVDEGLWYMQNSRAK